MFSRDSPPLSHPTLVNLRPSPSIVSQSPSVRALPSSPKLGSREKDEKEEQFTDYDEETLREQGRRWYVSCGAKAKRDAYEEAYQQQLAKLSSSSSSSSSGASSGSSNSTSASTSGGSGGHAVRIDYDQYLTLQAFGSFDAVRLEQFKTVQKDIDKGRTDAANFDKVRRQAGRD